MLISDEIVSWQVNEALDSKCRIRVVKLNNTGTVTQLKNYYIVASDLGNGPGTSISHSAPFLIPLVCQQYKIGLAEMIWFEHYPHKEGHDGPTLDVAMPGPSKSCCGSACSQMIAVDWRPARPNEITHLQLFMPDIMQ